MVEAEVLEAEHILKLASGDMAAVKIPSLLPAPLCLQTLRALDRLPREPYDIVRVHPPIVHFGPVLNDHRTESGVAPRYWRVAESSQEAWRSTGLSPDPMVVARHALDSAWGSESKEATVEGRPAFAGVIREINHGTLIHNDNIMREFGVSVLDQRVVAQLAFNVYLSVGATGGATTVWRRKWRPSDEANRIRYGHADVVVADALAVTVAPLSGDALLFNSEHYHAVRPIVSGRRVSLAFFIGMTSTDGLIVWS
ncbi:2OG-Fe(II) oxygenase [Actinomycetes bacterium KLBMP 9797]